MANKINEFATLKKIITILDDANIPYMLTGSLAMNFYGHARATNDIDIVVLVAENSSKKLFQLLEKDFYVAEEAIKEALSHKTLFNVIDQNSVFKVDLIICKNDFHSQESFSRRQKIKFDDYEISVISPEDLILAKLEWLKATNSEIQKNDIVNILKISDENLDHNYLQKTTKAKGLFEGLEKIYASIGYKS